MTQQAQTAETPRQAVERVAAGLGLSIACVFVPLSQSRNAKPGADGKRWESLNWTVTVSRNGRPFLITDYSQGAAHTPAHKSEAVMRPGERADPRFAQMLQKRAISAECETGKVHGFGETWRHNTQGLAPTSKPVPAPDLADVLYSLASDSDVLEAGGFEQWAGDLGYDTDSRSAEATYRACLEIALKLRAAIGEEGLKALREACQDY